MQSLTVCERALHLSQLFHILGRLCYNLVYSFIYININVMSKKQTVSTIPTFRAWYESKYKTRLPLYLQTDVKVLQMALYLKETNQQPLTEKVLV
jgi:hypothetical protein